MIVMAVWLKKEKNKRLSPQSKKCLICGVKADARFSRTLGYPTTARRSFSADLLAVKFLVTVVLCFSGLCCGIEKPQVEG